MKLHKLKHLIFDMNVYIILDLRARYLIVLGFSASGSLTFDGLTHEKCNTGTIFN